MGLFDVPDVLDVPDVPDVKPDDADVKPGVAQGVS